MISPASIIAKDLQHIWHPCTQMKDFETCPPVIVESAKGSYLYTNQGPLIDAISSWWCKSLGHGHPAVIAAITQQLNRFEHVISATTTHPLLVELGEKLAKISKKQHVFFASDGSSAVEVALKLALHANQLRGNGTRTEIIALNNSYHGETFATLSVSDLGLYKKYYEGYGVTCHFINPSPYITGKQDPRWENAEKEWGSIYKHLETVKKNVCAILVEPLIQGAGGMLCYSPYFLKKLAQWAKENDIFFIADEIMTGIGRTGKWLALDHAGIEADIICLSKGLTSGTIPLSCVLIDHAIYELFYDDYLKGNSFLHSHTYSGNALAVSAALATLNTIEKEGINEQAAELGRTMQNYFTQIGATSGKLKNIRALGAIVAGDLVPCENPRLSFKIYQEGLKRGAYLRPLGHTLYWLPPLTTDKDTLLKLADITQDSLSAAYN